jgi:hypothetical protein
MKEHGLQDKYAGIGLVKTRDPGAHVMDPRAIMEEHSNGLSKLEWFTGMAISGGHDPIESIGLAKKVIELLKGEK